jgi:KDO2-lipid IV(A) lauroyltransferase
VIHPELPLPPDPTAATARMTAAIEAQIRSHPEQWVWLHRRWRRKPEAARPPGSA